MHRLLLLIVINILLFSSYCFARYYFVPSVLIVPHHNFVASSRQKVIAEVARRRFSTKTVILLSPDHFNPNQYLLTTTDSDWKLANGSLLYDDDVGSHFLPLLTRNDPAIKNDHGIYNLLPDIHTAFPQAKVIPILIGQNLQPTQLDKLAQSINNTCRTDCLLIASVDFSHYLPALLADVHDAFSLKLLSNLDSDRIMQAEVDSPQSLYLALRFAQTRQASRFILKSHTNSGALMNNFDGESTSHIMGWYQPGSVSPINSQTFVFAKNFDRKTSQHTVGDRFFYGADITNVKVDSNIVTDNFVVAGIKQNHQWQLFYFPLTGIGSDRKFARGFAKQNALYNLLH